MKRKTYFCISLCILSITLFLWNCTDTELVKNDAQVHHKNFSLEEAKEFFEKQSLNYAVSTRAGKERKKKKFSPGDIVPIWENAVASSNKNIACYDIPIESEYKYKAMYGDYKNGKASAKIVDVYQKLIIVKDIQTDQLGQYILTLIPDKDYEDKYKKRICDRFINCKDKADFTGIAIYTIPNLDLIIRANHYTNGVKDQGVYLPGNKKLLNKKVAAVRSLLKNLIMKRKVTIATRSYGEDDWLWDDDDWLWDDDDDDDEIEYNDWDKTIIDEWENNGGTVVEIGDSWLFVDENGDWFAMEDSDGNGYPDSVIITPDPDPDPDPYPEFPEIDGSEDDGDSGGNEDYNDYEATNPITEKSPVKKIKEKLDKATKEKIGERNFSIKEGKMDDYAIGTFGNKSVDDILYNNIPTSVTIKDDLTDIQTKLVMTHEYVHIILLEESRKAGDAENFEKNNKDLYDAITDKENLNEGHHEYMGQHTDIMEDILREAFPGESDDFYNYGKWAGGATDSSAFRELSQEEQQEIKDFLKEHKL